jgi:tape measure domain-containing protein
LAQLTREVNNQRTPLERFIRKIEVINQASSRLSPKDVEDRIRAVANSFLEAEKKAGRYRDALSALEAFTPQLAQEARNLRQSYDDLLKTEKELAEINARLAGEEALRVSQQESKRIQIEKQVLDFKKKQREEAAALAREEARMAMEIEKLKRAARKRERDDYVEEVSQNQKSLQLVERKIYNLESERKHYGTLLFLKKQIVMEEVKEDLVLKKLIQDEERQNALVARRMNLYRQMPSVMSRSQGVMAGARQFAQGASMGGMPGGMLVGMHPGAIAGMAVVGGIVASIKAYKDLRDNLVLLESQFGNTTDAQATFLQLRQLAAKSPLETRDLMAGAVTLKQYGLANAEVMPTMEKLAAVSGGSSERLAGLTRAFAQTSSAGKLMGQEVLQFVNSGFNPLNEMAKRTNVSMLELRKMMENGLLTSQDMKDSFTSATQEGGQFHGQMAKQAEELSAKYNAMIDSLRQVGEAIGGFLELPTKGVMRVFTDLFTHTANQLNILGKSSKMVFSAAFDQQNFVQNQESMWIDLENTMIGYYAYLTKQDFGPAIQKQDNLFASFEKRRLEAIEKEAKAREKARLLIEDEIFGLTAAKDAQEEFNAILMTKSQLEERDNAKKMEAFRLESERIANLKAQAEQISQPEGKRGSFQQILDKYMKESQSEQENFSKILEKTPLAKAAREILDRSQQDFLKNNPQVAIMEQAQRIADMINGGMLTMQQGSAELARVMQENTNATQQQSYDLPRTLQAGTVEAYQAMFGRDNTAKLQLAEQKRQVAEQQKANGLLNDLVNKNPIKAMN